MPEPDDAAMFSGGGGAGFQMTFKTPSEATRQADWRTLAKAAKAAGIDPKDLRALAKTGTLVYGKHYIRKDRTGTKTLAFFEFNVTELLRERVFIEHRIAAMRASKSTGDFERKQKECQDYDTLGKLPERPWVSGLKASPKRKGSTAAHPLRRRKRA